MLKEIPLFWKEDKIKDAFKKDSLHKLKLRALQRIAKCFPFEHRGHLSLLIESHKNRFLEPEEATFIEFLLKKYEVRDYLYWAWMTKKLHQELEIRRENHGKSIKGKPKNQYLFFSKFYEEKWYSDPLRCSQRLPSVETLQFIEYKKERGQLSLF